MHEALGSRSFVSHTALARHLRIEFGGSIAASVRPHRRSCARQEIALVELIMRRTEPAMTREAARSTTLAECWMCSGSA